MLRDIFGSGGGMLGLGIGGCAGSVLRREISGTVDSCDAIGSSDVVGPVEAAR